MDRAVFESALANEEATDTLGATLASHLRVGDVVLLEGDLGAGKTALVRAIARALGVPQSIAVTSPTFALVHELPGRMPIIHGDLYRLDHASQLVELGLDEHLGGEAIVFLEWGERFLDALGAITLVVRLSLTGESSRKVRIEALSARGDSVVGAVKADFDGL